MLLLFWRKRPGGPITQRTVSQSATANVRSSRGRWTNPQAKAQSGVTVGAGASTIGWGMARARACAGVTAKATAAAGIRLNDDDEVILALLAQGVL